MGNENVNRCEWAKSELAIDYHDNEWAVPQHEDLILFEHLFLDTMQAGLSWELMLKKRENFRMAFDNFDPYIISGFLTIQRELGSFDRYLWSFVGGKPIVNEWRRLDQIPSRSMEAEILSKDLKSRGFKFVGPTICYAFMQAVGVVNDHTVDCFRYTDIAQMT
jgi:DNA-3-methyladenine glycosylase I